jgi:glutamate--cysteine ligase catalytic subunit
LASYLDLVSDRAAGRLCTTARWIRDFVDAHPAYKHDSVVDEQINKDLVAAVIHISDAEQASRGFAGLGIPNLDRLLGRYRGGCGGFGGV